MCMYEVGKYLECLNLDACGPLCMVGACCRWLWVVLWDFEHFGAY